MQRSKCAAACHFLRIAQIVSDAWGGYNELMQRGYQHVPVAIRGNPAMAEDYLPIVHLVFANLKSWLLGIHHGVSRNMCRLTQRICIPLQQAVLSVHSFRSLLGISGRSVAPTYEGLYSGSWQHPRCSRSFIA